MLISLSLLAEVKSVVEALLSMERTMWYLPTMYFLNRKLGGGINNLNQHHNFTKTGRLS